MTAGMMYAKRILLIDDDDDVLRSVSFLLKLAGYVVYPAKTASAALVTLREQIIHVAIIDVRLESGSPDDISGLQVADRIPESIPKIIYTAYPNLEVMRQSLEDSLGRRRAEKFVGKTGPTAPDELLRAVAELFAHRVPVNFDLQISDRQWLTEIATALRCAKIDECAADVEEILRRLFYSARNGISVLAVDLKYLVPLTALTMSCGTTIVLQATPKYADGRGASRAIKLGVRQEIEEEYQGFHDLTPRLRGARHAELRAQAYSREWGGLNYALLGADRLEDLILLQRYYQDNSPQEVVAFLRKFLAISYKEILEDKEERRDLNLRDEYAPQLHLRVDRLKAAIEPLLSDAALINQPSITLAGLNCPVRNPYVWAVPQGEFRSFEKPKTYVAWCHGDLHSRNVLVDNSGNGWFIDFARARKSHVLRDFVELETDIKFALLPVTDLNVLLPFEQALLEPVTLQQPLPDRLFDDNELQKAYLAVREIRLLAYQLIAADLDMAEYYQALLYHTLNVVRLGPSNSRDFDKERDRRHPLMAAALICERLEHWSGTDR
jgi:CheY-like chemotaxis protein